MNILVSMRMVENATYSERRDAISHDWSDYLDKLGIVPLLVPNRPEAAARYLDGGARGLLLTGGDDMGPPGQPTQRDLTEEILLKEALARKLPVFGVCRGLQVINRHYGGAVSTVLPEPHVGDHAVTMADGTTRMVNSFHTQGVLQTQLAPVLQAFAQTGKGVIEALRHRDAPVMAVQWHPERPSPSADLDRELMREWLARCA
jgi:gamma-glutamyl-gamma-aminobutyrate hydrolase PuuD